MSCHPLFKNNLSDGEHPTTLQHIIGWLEETSEGWNADPTAFVWGGKRKRRRDQALDRRHALGDTQTPLGGQEPRIDCAPMPSSPEPGQARVRSVETEQESLHLRLRHLTLLVLLTPPVRGHALRLVHRQHCEHDQHYQSSTGGDHH